jgi:uncharacterized membrane protein YkoI
MADRAKKTIVCLAALGVTVVGGAQVAGAVAKTKRSHATHTTAGTHQGNGETVLTGTTADQVKAAVLAKLPGATVERASTETDGKSTDAYEVHATKADGTRVEVLLDSSYAVTAVNAGHGRGHRGDHGRHGGPGGPGGSGETPLTGATLDKVKAAVVAYLPGSTVERATTENDGSSTDAYEAQATKSDGARVKVLLDSSFNVTSVK